MAKIKPQQYDDINELLLANSQGYLQQWSSPGTAPRAARHSSAGWGRFPHAPPPLLPTRSRCRSRPPRCRDLDSRDGESAAVPGGTVHHAHLADSLPRARSPAPGGSKKAPSRDGPGFFRGRCRYCQALFPPRVGPRLPSRSPDPDGSRRVPNRDGLKLRTRGVCSRLSISARLWIGASQVTRSRCGCRTERVASVIAGSSIQASGNPSTTRR